MKHTLSLKLSFAAITLICLSACHNQTQQRGINGQAKQSNSSKLNSGDLGIQSDSIKIDGFYVNPKKLFGFNSVGDINHDTLTLVTCSDYIFSPFGALKDKSRISGSLLKNFTSINRLDTMDVGVVEFQILKHESSRLILFFDQDKFASRESYVFDGDIKDSDVNLAERIRIGMSKRDFIMTFFEKLPDELMRKYDIIAFESCVDGIRHTYIFKDGKLDAIYFRSHSYWKVSY
jgi:hypothetical protein